MRWKKEVVLSGVFFLLIIGIIYVYFPSEKPGVSVELHSKEGNSSGCIEGEVKNCTIGAGCGGVSICTDGKWSSCLSIPKTCIPGKVKTCWNGCIKGKQVCNECGTGYSECTPL